MNFLASTSLVLLGVIIIFGQIYGLIVGICTIFVGIYSVFASQVFSGQTVVLSLNLETYVPFFIVSPALSKFLLGLALLIASLQKRSLWGGLLGGGNIYGGVVGLFGAYTSTALTLTGFWGGVLSIILLLWLGGLIVTLILPSGSSDTRT